MNLTYYVLTKPGIIMGNIITTVAGFLLASKGYFDPWLFTATVFGLSFIIASACVCNNYIDRHVDAKMERTKNRALVKGSVSLRNALLFAAFLGIVGFTVLGIYTNLLTLSIAIAGFVIYVFVYSFGKCLTYYSTLVGSLAGAVPPLVGYCAVANTIDTGAILLFMILVLWQMPHFYAIATYRLPEYKAAGIPVLPNVKGIYITKIQMLLYTIAFVITASLLTVFGYTGYVYLASSILLGFAWLVLSIQGFKAKNDSKWARQMFRFSLLVITILSIVISLDAYTP